jgi:hypothetical protein
MPLSANPAARSALTYITVGALMNVWSGVWFWYMYSTSEGNRDGTWWYICTGIMLSGLVLIVIGLLIGRIGREARRADAPPAPPHETRVAADAQMANAAHVNATQANAAGTPVLVIPAGAHGAVPAAGVPGAAAPGLPTAVPPAPGTRQNTV